MLPQLAGLGHSQMAQMYAIGSLAEARDYLAHPLLGARLRECAQVLLDLPEALGATEMRSSTKVDALTRRLSMTLFAHAYSKPQYLRTRVGPLLSTASQTR